MIVDMTTAIECAKAEGVESGSPDSSFRERSLLQIWFSPSFPIGSFAYSQGLESAVEAEFVRDEEALRAWIADLLQFGPIRNDLLLISCAWKAASTKCWHDLRGVAEFAAAFQPSAERYLEAVTQGASFLAIVAAAWPCESLIAALDSCGGAPVVYAVSAGMVSASHGLRLQPTIEAFALSFVTNQISAAIRLGVIGQTAGQRVIAALLPLLAGASARACEVTLDDIGSASFSADLLTLEHETLHTRLFRT